MARGPRFTVRLRRKREGKTDYKSREKLLKSRQPRLVIRKSNKYIVAQIVKYETEGDKTLAHATSKQLKKLGWKHSCKNLPAAYLTGLMLAKEAKKAKVEKAILDAGSYTLTKGCAIYAAAQGAIEGGLEVPHGKAILIDEKRIKGEHLKNKEVAKDFESLKAKIK